jgi:hypothetical protein
MSATTTLADSRAPSGHLVSVDRPQLNDEKSTSKAEPLSDGERPADPQAGNKEIAETAERYPGNIVGWDGPDDPECPRNWSGRKKFFFVAVTSSVIAAVSFGSSVFAPAASITAAEFGVSVIVMRLAVALWILGFFAGPVSTRKSKYTIQTCMVFW